MMMMTRTHSDAEGEVVVIGSTGGQFKDPFVPQLTLHKEVFDYPQTVLLDVSSDDLIQRLAGLARFHDYSFISCLPQYLRFVTGCGENTD